MDSLTQIVLGGAVGEAILGKKAGNKAVLWGAIAGTIPDLDVLASPFLDTVGKVYYHRGVSHSLIFCVAMAPVLGYMISRIHKKMEISARDWSWLAFGSLVTHPLLDIFTTWGTQFFWPFTDYGIAFNSIFILDPLYTVPFLVCLVWVLFLRKERRRRRIVNWVGIGLSTAYLGFSLINKARADAVFAHNFAQQGIKVERFMSRPSPLNILYWGVVAESAEGLYIGYYSLPGGKGEVKLRLFPKGEWPAEFEGDWGMETLKYISKGYYRIRPTETGWTFEDLRFGRTGFRMTEAEKCMFTYEVKAKPEGGLEIRSVSNFSKIDGEAFGDLWKGILGKEQ